MSAVSDFPKRFAVVIQWPGGRKIAYPYDTELEAEARFKRLHRIHPYCDITMVDCHLNRIITREKGNFR